MYEYFLALFPVVKEVYFGSFWFSFLFLLIRCYPVKDFEAVSQSFLPYPKPPSACEEKVEMLKDLYERYVLFVTKYSLFKPIPEMHQCHKKYKDKRCHNFTF